LRFVVGAEGDGFVGGLKEVAKRGGFELEIRGVRGDCSGYLAMVQFLPSYV